MNFLVSFFYFWLVFTDHRPLFWSLTRLTRWSILSSAFLHSLHSMSFWLLSILALTKFVLTLWFCAATIRLSVSLFKSPFRNQTQLPSLLTSLVCLKYWLSPPKLALYSRPSLSSKKCFYPISPSSLYWSFLNSININLQNY